MYRVVQPKLDRQINKYLRNQMTYENSECIKSFPLNWTTIDKNFIALLQILMPLQVYEEQVSLLQSHAWLPLINDHQFDLQGNHAL